MSFTTTSTAPVLEGDLVRLEPLDHRHAADLAAAAEEERTSYRYTWVPPAAEVGDYIDAQLARAAAGTLAPYAQVAKATGRAVGATAYWDPRLWPDRNELCAVEVGFTWLAASAQGAGLNTEAKFLLFAYAFEQWRVVRVDLKTDARTTVLARRSSVWARDSRAYYAAGRGLGRPVRTGCSGTPPCIRSSPRNGQPAGPDCRPSWRGQGTVAPRWSRCTAERAAHGYLRSDARPHPHRQIRSSRGRRSTL